MWLFRRKKIVAQEERHKKELAIAKSVEKRRYNRAVRPIKDMNNLLEENGITLQIRRGMGNKHV